MADDYLPDLYTDRDIEKARRRGKYVGWVQGGGAVLLLGVGYSIIGWIPTIAILGSSLSRWRYRIMFMPTETKTTIRTNTLRFSILLARSQKCLTRHLLTSRVGISAMGPALR